jgi:FHA domain
VLATLVTDIRAATGDNARRPRFVRTAHGHGYAFNGEILPDGPDAGGATAPWYLLWDHRQIRLRHGENILGRSGAGVVIFGSPTVSKRHARVIVTDQQAIIEDLGSKNGTGIGDRAVNGPTPIAEGESGRPMKGPVCGVRAGSRQATLAARGDITPPLAEGHGPSRIDPAPAQYGLEGGAVQDAVARGLHFRTGCVQGVRHGEQVGRFVIQHSLRPLKVKGKH